MHNTPKNPYATKGGGPQVNQYSEWEEWERKNHLIQVLALPFEKRRQKAISEVNVSRRMNAESGNLWNDEKTESILNNLLLLYNAL